MADYHKYDGKFGDTPDKIAKQDPNFRKGMKEAIESKNLRQVLIYASRKAQAAAADLNLSEIETFQFGYELFVSVFNEIKMPEDRKEKMAETVNDRLLEAVGVVTSKKMGVSPEYAEKMVTEQLETGVAPSPIQSQQPASPMTATSQATPSVAPPAAPVPSVQRPASMPVVTAPYQKYSQKYRAMANQIIQQDSSFQASIVMSIESKNLKQLLLSLIQKTKNVSPNLGLTNEDAHQIAYELFASVFAGINLPDQQKIMMANTVDSKLIEMIPIASAQPPPAPALASSPVSPSTPAPRPKVFSSALSSAPVSAQADGQTIQEMLTPSSGQTSTQGGDPVSTSQDDLLRQQREALRVQRQEQQQPTPQAQAARPATGFDPFATMDQWLRSDKRLIQVVDHFEKRGPNVIRVVLDPESEGFVPYIDITLTVGTFGDKNIIRGEFVGELGLKYPYSMAVGDNGKRWVAVSLYDKIPDDENETMEQLRKVDVKNQLEWDRLMVMLNNDKDFMKSVKSLELKNPANSKDVIRVPVYIKKDIPSNKAIVRTYITPSLKPSTIFFDVMDHIAENLSQLGDSADVGISASLSMKFDQISQQTQSSMASHSMRFLAQDDSSLNYKTCPYCGRPFPNPNADYRRCPNCLAKLK